MAITLNQALRIGGLSKCSVVSGDKGMERDISNVTIMEVPDIVRWLKGKELLLTSLYPIKDDEKAMKNLVKELHARGTSALAIKPHRFIDKIPKVILDEAEKYHFPIIEIPEEVTYLDILSPVMNIIFNDKVVIQEDLEQAYQLLDEIKLNKVSINQLAVTLKHLMKYETKIDSFVPYISIPSQEIDLAPITEGQKRELRIVQRPVRMNRWNPTLEKEQACIIAPLIIEGNILGAITSIGVEKGFLEVDLDILERAITTLSIEFLRKKASYDLEQQYKSDFFRDLLFSQIQHEEILLEKGRMFGFDLKHQYTFVTIQFSPNKEGITFIAELVEHLEFVCSQFDRKVIIGAFQNGLYLLYPSSNKSKERIDKELETIYKSLKNKIDTEIYIGVGRPAMNLNDIRDGYDQAYQAVILGRTLHDNKHIIYYEELGFYRLLATFNNTTEVKKFYEESIGSLIHYDENHDLELITTLSTYFAHNESISKTAEALFIHINTMKYRLQRIKAITSLDIRNSEDKLILQVCLKIHHFIQNDYRFR